MNSIVGNLYELQHNPFKYGEYLVSFYHTIQPSEHNFLLAQLIIPLCSHYFFGEKLLKAKKNSSIWTIFLSPIHKNYLYDLQERIEEFSDLTVQSIQYCLVNDWFFIDTQRLIIYPNDQLDHKLTSQKCAQKLAQLFNDFSTLEIYSHLGIKPQ